MLFAIFTLAASLSGTSLPANDVLDVALDVRAVALEDEPLFDGSDARERTARLLLVWAWHESRWRAGAIGDNGAACGRVRRVGAHRRSVLQLHELARGGVTCAAMVADRRVGLRAGLAWMRAMRDACGSVRGGLNAFAAGTCAGSLRSRALVSHRCKLAGAAC